MQQIGRYQILGELGRGAMGIVYKAQDPAIGRTIAIKSIRLHDLTDDAERERLRERLFREAQSAGILSHPGIVTIYDIAEEEGMAYIFMEFVNGPPLEKMLRHEQTPDKETLLSIFRQTAAALDYAHKKGIVHRDIKPANIMIHEDGSAKVTDFGVAKIVSQQMTQSGTMMGTPSYMSPEQVQGATISGAADQFSLAVIVYEVMTGEKPFVAEYMPTLLYKIVREEPGPPQRLNPTLGKKIETVLRKALSKTPGDRYETCVDFISALSIACAESKGWTPLPRGVSPNMPTSGSQEGLNALMDATLDSTVVDTPPIVVVAPPALAAAEETVAKQASEMAIEPPPWLPKAPSGPEPSSRALRNVMLILGTFLVVGAGLYFGTRQFGASPAPAPQQPEQAAAPTPAPAPPVQQEAKPEPKTDLPKPTDDPAPAPIRTARQAQPEPDSPFQLTTEPSGAEVVFDGNQELKCTSPCNIPLGPGRHTFAVRHAGFRDVQKIIEIPRDTGLIVDLERLVGTLSVITNPAGLTLSVDGQEQSRKTPASLTLAAGPHHVVVTKGSDKQEFDVDIRDGLLTSKFIEWQ